MEIRESGSNLNKTLLEVLEFMSMDPNGLVGQSMDVLATYIVPYGAYSEP